ncbi:MAG: ABC transporter substrate-binding protein [Alphaproteobacteria bacterium]|nr:ABC transporter substrate-binding protein [Alphaproteobacteria bacterium]
MGLRCWSKLLSMAAALFAWNVGATELRLAIETEPAIDPHFLFATTNTAVSRHVFDAITDRDEDLQPRPGLAESWRLVDPLTWEFKLRGGVTFHDGSPLTAEDVAFSIARIPAIPNNPNPYTPLIRSIDKVEVVDPLLVRIRTKFPDAILPNQLAGVFVVSRNAARDAQPADFRSGKAAIGTGPYRFVAWKPGDRLELARNDTYWGGAQPWERVTLRVIANDAARTVSLRSGEIDVVGNLNPAHAETLAKDPGIRLFKRPSDRVVYLILDVARATTPMATDRSGQPLARNPLQDPRVRQALSMAINRDALAERVLDGFALPAHQLVPEGITGYAAAIPKQAYDPQAARKLLADAGYPDGFGLTLNGPNDRYLNDAKTLEAMGQMLSRIGLQVKVVTEPWNVYFPKARVTANLEGLPYSAMLVGWGHSVGDTSGLLTTVLHSFDTERRFGSGNRSGYRNAEFDRAIQDAVAEMEPAVRRRKLEAVMATAARDLTTIPLYNNFVIMAARAGFTLSPRMDDEVQAMSVRPAR